MADCIYQFDGKAYNPTEWARGPWSEFAQHGGPPSALLAKEIESRVPDNMRIVRITIELLKPIPMMPLTTRAEVTRSGKRVQIVEAEMTCNDQLIATAKALVIRYDANLDLPPALHDIAAPAMFDSWEANTSFPITYTNLFQGGLEVRYAKGTANAPGPSRVWTRLAKPLVEGHETSPVQRVLVAADCGNGVSREVDFATHVFINPDLTLYLHHYPEGEWICMEAVTDVGEGVGLAQAQLYDSRRVIGRSLQALYIDRR